MSTPNKVAAFLETLNAWRRGDETIEMPHPAEIGENIQNAIVLLRKNAELETELATEREKSERYRLATLRLDADLTAERARTKQVETALADAISTYFGDDKLVSAERIEAWQAALKEVAK